MQSDWHCRLPSVYRVLHTLTTATPHRKKRAQHNVLTTKNQKSSLQSEKIQRYVMSQRMRN